MDAVATTTAIAATVLDRAMPDRPIRGDGETPETEWRNWLQQRSPPPLDAAWLGRAGQRLVVVSPHPDDEVLACGGLLATHLAGGGEVSIVAVTDGEASHPGDAHWPPPRLAAARREERLRGLARLGVSAAAVSCVGLADGGVAPGREALREALRTALRSGDVVASTWSFDGHPDHDATGAEVAHACAERACTLLQAPVWMWHWSAPDDARVPWPRLRGFALAPEAQRRKARALAEHLTQLAPRAAEAPVLGAAILARAARDTEYFFV